MKLLVIRHATTKGNEQRIINGLYDDELTEAGRAELPALVERLHGEAIDAVFASPLARAVDTAMPVAKDHGLELHVDSRLSEVAMGTFTRQPYESTLPVFGYNSSDLLSTYSYDMTAYGGESAAQVQERVQAFLNDLKQEPYQTALVVTHGGIIRWIYYLCKGEKVHGFPNLSVHEFEL